jgi:quercetin dioxygenase-like cupin family protein
LPQEDFFPEIITNLPQADVPLAGVRAYLFQGEDKQLVFMTFPDDVDVPEHAHAAQWGVVLAGEIELTIGGEAHAFRPGDTYFVPEGVPHRARIKGGSSLQDLFDQVDRYAAK